MDSSFSMDKARIHCQTRENSAPSKFWYRLLQLLTIFRECLKEYVVEEETFLHSG